MRELVRIVSRSFSVRYEISDSYRIDKTLQASGNSSRTASTSHIYEDSEVEKGRPERKWNL